MLHNSKGKLKGTNQNLLVSDLADVYVSWIIPKCLLMCATPPPPFFFFKRTTHPIWLWILCLFSEFLPCYMYLTFFKLLYRLLATGPSWIKYCTTKYNPLILCFQVENHVLTPQLLCWDRTFFAGRNADWMGTVFFRSLLPSGLTIPVPSVNITAPSSQFIYMTEKEIMFLFKLSTNYLLLHRSG